MLEVAHFSCTSVGVIALMGLFSRKKPKIKISSTKKDGFSGWIKCTQCTELIHAHELGMNLSCCPKCSYHYRLSVEERIHLLTDEGGFEELVPDIYPVDSLHFVDTESYVDRLKAARQKSGRDDAIVTGKARLSGMDFALGVLDFGFMGGSMGSVVGEKVTRLVEYAMDHQLPLIIVSTSGGARMQESTLSLMQMAKTAAILSRFHEQGLLYISILTNPTTGGVTASFASLGDILIAEPRALICFAGPRVIEQILGKPLPEGAQQSEFLLQHGMIDAIIDRHQLRSTIERLLKYSQARRQTRGV
jgi:acetyl-CoA carboxylase carboxyl transferase subunit beta